jgi:hypothetical protein
LIRSRIFQEQDASIKVIGISLADEEVLSAALEMLNLGPVYDSAALHSRCWSGSPTYTHRAVPCSPAIVAAAARHISQSRMPQASPRSSSPCAHLRPALTLCHCLNPRRAPGPPPRHAPHLPPARSTRARRRRRRSALWADHGPLWLAHAAGRAAMDWPALLRNHTAVAGAAAAADLPALLAAFPAARVVVAAGDPRRAARALAAGRHGFEAHWAVRLMALLVPPLARELALADRAHAAALPGAAGGAAGRLVRPDEEDRAVAALRRWAERAAAAAAPAGRALVWDAARDGWGPLCAHLGAPAPPPGAAPPPAAAADAAAARWGRRRALWHAAAYAVLAGPAAALLVLAYLAGHALGFRAGRRHFRPAVAPKKAQ